MTINLLRSAVAAGLALHLAAGPGFAAPVAPAIGVVVTTGAFRLNHATVRSNATLFEGAMVETGAVPARVDLAGGARLELESESAGRVLRGHLLLDRGATRIGGASGSTTGHATGFAVEARGLTIQPGASGAAARIALIGAARVEVAALAGSFRVLNSGGVLVAAIAAGRALALEPRPTPGPARITGRLVRRGGHYLLTDETTNVTVEVVGSASTEPGLKQRLGERVQVTGSALPDAIRVRDATQLIEVAQVTPAPPSPGNAPAGSGGARGDSSRWCGWRGRRRRE